MKRLHKFDVRSVQPRTGAAMVFALMALLLASLMIAGLLRTVSMSHHQLKRDEFRLQASLLADAGCARAIAQLQRQPEFTYETWRVPAEQLTGERTAVVHLTVSGDPAQPARKIVSVIAEYPSGHPDVVRITRSIPLP